MVAWPASVKGALTDDTDEALFLTDAAPPGTSSDFLPPYTGHTGPPNNVLFVGAINIADIIEQTGFVATPNADFAYKARVHSYGKISRLINHDEKITHSLRLPIILLGILPGFWIPATLAAGNPSPAAIQTDERGLADEVGDALLRAADRGVICRILLDDVGSRSFLRGKMVRKLREGGIHVVAALRAGWFRSLFVRFDLRLHRKIVVIDGTIAYTGSQNMVDPDSFKQDSGVGQWVDAMVRLQGPCVEALAEVFLGDWELESPQLPQVLAKTSGRHHLKSVGTSVVQVVPSGPLLSNDAIQKILLMAFYSARRELVLTTPYFVPDDALAVALSSAARRGVEVTLIVPARVDSKLVDLASQSAFGDLEAAGIRIARFEGGLLHTKSITIDGQFSFFGSLNLDQRSLSLNFEVTLVTYDSNFTGRLRQLQEDYLAKCSIADSLDDRRSMGHRLVENTARLIGPLL